ncbi:hypothetical protein EKD16_19640 [Streptomonospora litoralis]|uniref:Uncharacterized protein n=1 Tax=Streptomonospora litoralis TaxID=2498135 RepID=A0A4P6Q877_9ACTN|nr:hypothetical protein EKD16_19640 [Streptomonospora litoralis]
MPCARPLGAPPPGAAPPLRCAVLIPGGNKAPWRERRHRGRRWPGLCPSVRVRAGGGSDGGGEGTAGWRGGGPGLLCGLVGLPGDGWSYGKAAPRTAVGWACGHRAGCPPVARPTGAATTSAGPGLGWSGRRPVVGGARYGAVGGGHTAGPGARNAPTCGGIGLGAAPRCHSRAVIPRCEIKRGVLFANDRVIGGPASALRRGWRTRCTEWRENSPRRQLFVPLVAAAPAEVARKTGIDPKNHPIGGWGSPRPRPGATSDTSPPRPPFRRTTGGVRAPAAAPRRAASTLCGPGRGHGDTQPARRRR